MGKERVETFSDGVLAIIMTIMVLELKVPHGADINVLKLFWPVFLSYLLGFVYIGIYWNNHHHLFHVTEQVSGGVMWANLPLLFWLSLIPFVTAWMGENRFEAAPTALYGLVLLMASVSFWILQLAAACPTGIDIYFENVGGAVFDAVLPLLNVSARIPLCGLIANYNDTALPSDPDRLGLLTSTLLTKRIKMQGFIIFDDYGHRYNEFFVQTSAWLKEGKNFGKLIIRVAND